MHKLLYINLFQQNSKLSYKEELLRSACPTQSAKAELRRRRAPELSSPSVDESGSGNGFRPRSGRGFQSVRTSIVLLTTAKAGNLLRFRRSHLTFNLNHTFPKPRVKRIPLIFLMPGHLRFYAREPKWKLSDRKRIHFLVAFRKA